MEATWLSQLSKTTKIALILQYYTVYASIDEYSLMESISWIINGIDESRIDWDGILEVITTEGENDNG